MALLRGYFKNLSTFRMLVLAALITTGIAYLYARYRGSENGGYDEERYRRIIDTLLDSADTFGKRIHVQESLGVALALQCEVLGNRLDSENLGRMLKRILDQSQGFIQGVGIFLPESGNSPRQFSYISRTPLSPGDQFLDEVRKLEAERPEAAPSVEDSERRNVKWSLVSAPPGGGESRFFSLLSVELTGPVTGEAIIRADLDWLVVLLRRLRDVGAAHPLCVSPERNVIWLIGDHVVHDRDFSSQDDIPGGRIIRAASLFAGNAEYTESSEFIKADIMGTGWLLMIGNPNAKAHRPASLSIAAFMFIVAALALLFEAVISFLGPAAAARVSQRPQLFRGKETERAGGWRLVLSQAYKYLFQYRIANPDQERIDSELRVGRQIQFSLIPNSFPAYSEWREFDISSLLSPAREVSGDYYDFFLPDSNHLVLAVGDVSGKGVPAALYMAVTRTAFRSMARLATDPGRLFGGLNDTLVRESSSGLYVTVACFFVDLATGFCRYALAGHPAPLLYRREGGVAEYIDEPRQTFLGMKAGIDYPTGEIQLKPGDCLLLYTDGVTEAMNPEGEEFGYDRLKKGVSGLTDTGNCQELIADLERTLSAHCGGGEPGDDITLLAFRYWGPGGQKLFKRRERASLRGGKNEGTA